MAPEQDNVQADQQSAFTSEPNLIDDQYRPISISAVAALIVGLLGIVALFNPYLLLIPFGGAVLGVVSLIRIQRSKHPVSGVWLATIGLASALFFGCWATSYASSRNDRIYDQAHVHVDRWYALIQERRLYEAFELKIRYENRRMPGVDLEKVYQTTLDESTIEDIPDFERGGADPKMTETIVPGSPKMEFDEFFNTEPMKTIVANSADGEMTLLRNVLITRDGYRDKITQIYRFSYNDSSGTRRKIDFLINFERWRYPTEDHYHWNILGVDEIEVDENQVDDQSA